MPVQPHHLLVLSAKTRTNLEKIKDDLLHYLKENPNLNLADVAYSLQISQENHAYRLMVVCEDQEDAISALKAHDSRRVFTSHWQGRHRPVIFMFPAGFSLKNPNLGLNLYLTEPTFQEYVDICARLLTPHLGLDIRHVLYPTPKNANCAAQQLQKTSISIPIVFVLEYALARLWMSWGIQPNTMIGYSLGEYTAACLAGVISLEDILPIVALGGRLLEKLPNIALLHVPLPECKVKGLLNSKLSLIAVNGPSACIIGGEQEEILTLKENGDRGNVRLQPLQDSVPSHSRQVDLILPQFNKLAQNVTLQKPRKPYVSGLTGSWITTKDLVGSTYWGNVMRQTVNFDSGIRLVLENNCILLEVGPGQTLSRLTFRHPQTDNGHVILSSMKHSRNPERERAFFLNTLGHLWLSGAEVGWYRYYSHYNAQHRNYIPMPMLKPASELTNHIAFPANTLPTKYSDQPPL